MKITLPAYTTFPTPAGSFSLAVDGTGAVVATAFGPVSALRRRLGSGRLVRNEKKTAAARAQVKNYFRSAAHRFEVALAPAGTEFQKRVWAVLREIPRGTTRSYGQIARQLGSSARAVGRANATNPICLIIPCHRVIGAEGALTGFAYGTDLKRRLLAREGAAAAEIRPGPEAQRAIPGFSPWQNPALAPTANQAFLNKQSSRGPVLLRRQVGKENHQPRNIIMKAVRIHDFGSTDVLHIEDVPTPQPGPGEVLIKVLAASVNPVDYKTRSGEFKAQGATMPITLGRDIAGIVASVGRNVSGLKVGDEVFALLDRDHGGYAEYVIAKSGAVAPKPRSIDYVHAAGVPLAAITAWQGLFDYGKLKAGERVLIHGAAGGVGHFAVQFAKNRGAYVIATAGAEDRDLLRKLGADEVIDYRNERFEDRVSDADLVLDLVAGDTQRRSWQALKKGGRMVSTLQTPSKLDGALREAKGESFMAQPNRDQLKEIGRLIDEGKVQVVVQQTLPLEEVRRAHEFMEHQHVRGKLVLEVAVAG